MAMKRFNELGYLSLVKDVLNEGRFTTNRTGIRTKAIFGDQLHYDLRGNKIALITTKYVHFPSVAKELFWFLRGDTNQKNLAQEGVHIWRANSTKEFLKTRNLNHCYTEYESLGPIYGFQWRHFGAKYTNCHQDYTNQGYDQLAHVVEQLKNDPTSRRIIMSAWNPCDLDKMVLPPCHMMVQFSVDTVTRELSANMYQRSADLMLGVPYNLASYSLLLCLLAHKCNLKPGTLVCSYGDVHIYENHIENAKIQLARNPHDSPNLYITCDPDTMNMDKLQLDDGTIKLENYQHHERLFFQMAV